MKNFVYFFSGVLVVLLLLFLFMLLQKKDDIYTCLCLQCETEKCVSDRRRSPWSVFSSKIEEHVYITRILVIVTSLDYSSATGDLMHPSDRHLQGAYRLRNTHTRIYAYSKEYNTRAPSCRILSKPWRCNSCFQFFNSLLQISFPLLFAISYTLLYYDEDLGVKFTK